jgi:hypothetical protein
VFDESAPLASIVTYDYPPRDGMPPVRVVWYDGGLQPPRPKELDNRALGKGGVLYIGTKGKMLGDNVLASQGVAPSSIPKTLQRRGGIWEEWHVACRGGQPAGCSFDWAGPITEFVLLGNIAIRTGETLQWDANSRRFANSNRANAMLSDEYREGWSL